jgi:hypothetical protein
MAKIPKMPKGLKASIAKLERTAAKAKAIADRKKEIARLKAKKDALMKKKRGY